MWLELSRFGVVPFETAKERQLEDINNVERSELACCMMAVDIYMSLHDFSS